MPRKVRNANNFAIYHVMSRSISEVYLFRDDSDKIKYLQILKRYQIIFQFKLHAYCLMNNHIHLLIDCAGADLSKFMQCINLSYAIYFNKKYQRHGHLFQDRFKSIIVKDEAYLIRLSVYIHSNPKDIKYYKNKLERYRYSSLGIYLGLSSDELGILNCELILGHFSTDIIKSRLQYKNFMNIEFEVSEIKSFEFNNEGGNYISGRFITRDFKPEEILNFICVYTGKPFNINILYNKKNNELKSIFVLLVRSLCSYKYSKICEILGNVTLSNAARLCSYGYKLITEKDEYKTIIFDFLKTRIALAN